MGAVGRTLGIVVVLLLVAAGAAYFLVPPVASRTETFTVERPVESVFARLSSAPAGTQLAEGVTQNAVTEAANNRVVADVVYAEGGTGRAIYTVSEQGEASQVQLRLEKDLGPNPLDRVGAITGGGVPPLAEAAAASITSDLNALPEASFTGLAYDVTQIEARPFFFVQNCSASDAESVTSIIAQAVAGIPPVMRQKRIEPAGPLMAVEPRVVSGQYCFQVGYPYRGRPPTGALLVGQAGQTPAGTALHVHYTGAEADVLAQVYNPMDALLAAAHLDNPGTTDDDWTTYEVYNDDPMQEGGSRDRDIYYVTQGDISRLATIAPPTAPVVATPAAAETPAAPAATPAPAAPAPAAPAPATP